MHLRTVPQSLQSASTTVPPGCLLLRGPDVARPGVALFIDLTPVLEVLGVGPARCPLAPAGPLLSSGERRRRLADDDCVIRLQLVHLDQFSGRRRRLVDVALDALNAGLDLGEFLCLAFLCTTQVLSSVKISCTSSAMSSLVMV